MARLKSDHKSDRVEIGVIQVVIRVSDTKVLLFVDYSTFVLPLLVVLLYSQIHVCKKSPES